MAGVPHLSAENSIGNIQQSKEVIDYYERQCAENRFSDTKTSENEMMIAVFNPNQGD